MPFLCAALEQCQDIHLCTMPILKNLIVKENKDSDVPDFSVSLSAEKRVTQKELWGKPSCASPFIIARD